MANPQNPVLERPPGAPDARLTMKDPFSLILSVEGFGTLLSELRALRAGDFIDKTSFLGELCQTMEMVVGKMQGK